jgi:4'-phosphopantetheinyl transferase
VTAQFAALLSADESARAARFAFPHLREAFTLARGALRILLGRAEGAAPEDVRFSYGAKGKPELTPRSRVQFNASHSADLALIAITLDREIGVDVEQVRPMRDLAGIAARFFSAGETAQLNSLPQDQREAAFFRCWTRKEAYIKAIGDGLSVPLDSFAVSLRPGEPARMIQLGGSAGAAAAWTMHDLVIAREYAAALAYQDTARAVRISGTLDPSELLSNVRS